MRIPGFKGFFLNNSFLKKAIQPGKYLKDTLVGVLTYFQYRQALPPGADGKAVYLDISNNVYNRYLYIFVKYFQLQGYHVYLQAHPVTLRYIRHFEQSFLIIKERLVSFSLRRVPGCQLYLSDRGKSSNLSADYFSPLLLETPGVSTYHVPMAMHPLMYHHGWWQEPVASGRRYRSVFFAGNAHRGHYSIAEKDNVFNMVDRINMYDLLVQQPLTFLPKNMEELEEQSEDHQIVLVTKQHFMVPMPKLRPVLAKYSFFLACPGFVMPFSHNVIEAMSVGTIPIIQANYAKMFCPPLENGVNALLFDNEKDLLGCIEQALALDEDLVAKLSERVLAYYAQYLTPEKVVANLLQQDYDQVYLMAELPSVELLKKRLKKQARSKPSEALWASPDLV